MQIERISPSEFRILTPAKVNLWLDVLGKRDDGFHEILTVMCPVSLCDELTVGGRPDKRITFELELPDEAAARNSGQDTAWIIPDDRNNLVVRAITEVRDRLACPYGCHIRLKKQIPAAAGLGGGSSDAAAAMVGYMAAHGCWDRAIAASAGSKLGSDIPFFLGDSHRIGLAIATGRGEKCELLPYTPPLEFAILHPVAGCATREIYAGCTPSSRTKSVEKIVSACRSGQLQKIGAELFNALQSKASELNPWIEEQLSLFEECGCPHALMSGSGSSCFAIMNGREQAVMVEGKAVERGIPRAFFPRSWYSSSIEEQLSQFVE